MDWTCSGEEDNVETSLEDQPETMRGNLRTSFVLDRWDSSTAGVRHLQGFVFSLQSTSKIQLQRFKRTTKKKKHFCRAHLPWETWRLAGVLGDAGVMEGFWGYELSLLLCFNIMICRVLCCHQRPLTVCPDMSRFARFAIHCPALLEHTSNIFSLH